MNSSDLWDVWDTERWWGIKVIRLVSMGERAWVKETLAFWMNDIEGDYIIKGAPLVCLCSKHALQRCSKRFWEKTVNCCQRTSLWAAGIITGRQQSTIFLQNRWRSKHSKKYSGNKEVRASADADTTKHTSSESKGISECVYTPFYEKYCTTYL